MKLKVQVTIDLVDEHFAPNSLELNLVNVVRVLTNPITDTLLEEYGEASIESITIERKA